MTGAFASPGASSSASSGAVGGNLNPSIYGEHSRVDALQPPDSTNLHRRTPQSELLKTQGFLRKSVRLGFPDIRSAPAGAGKSQLTSPVAQQEIAKGPMIIRLEWKLKP